jgi:hypothetical protein
LKPIIPEGIRIGILPRDIAQEETTAVMNILPVNPEYETDKGYDATEVG